HTKARIKRGEGIVGNLGLGRSDGSKEGRLAGIGQAHQPCICNQLQAQPDGAFLSWEARIGAARGLIGRTLEVLIAEPAIATSSKQEALAYLGQVADERLVVFFEDLRPSRNLQDDVG